MLGNVVDAIQERVLRPCEAIAGRFHQPWPLWSPAAAWFKVAAKPGLMKHLINDVRAPQSPPRWVSWDAKKREKKTHEPDGLQIPSRRYVMFLSSQESCGIQDGISLALYCSYVLYFLISTIQTNPGRRYPHSAQASLQVRSMHQHRCHL